MIKFRYTYVFLIIQCLCNTCTNNKESIDPTSALFSESFLQFFISDAVDTRNQNKNYFNYHTEYVQNVVLLLIISRFL